MEKTKIKLNKTTISLTLTLIYMFGFLVFGQNLDKIKIATYNLNKNIYALVSRAGGNMIVKVGKNGLLLIDSDIKQLSKKIKNEIKKISDKPIKYIINTHWHFDHTGGNEILSNKGCEIIAHENVKKRMSKAQKIGILNIDVKPAPISALPTKLVKNKLLLSMQNEQIQILHLPKAHTDGDSCVYFKNANILHTGDIVFNYNYPFIDISSGGSIAGMIKAIDSMLNLCNEKTKIIPGHGPFLNKKKLEKYRLMLVEFKNTIQKEILLKKSLKEIQNSSAIQTVHDKYGYKHFPLKMFVKMIYLSLREK